MLDVVRRPWEHPPSVDATKGREIRFPRPLEASPASDDDKKVQEVQYPARMLDSNRPSAFLMCSSIVALLISTLWDRFSLFIFLGYS